MNKRIVLIAGVLALVGCTSPGVKGVTCESDADCGSGKCSNNVCVGGSGTGSSSSSTSGSSGSGSSSSSSSSTGSSGTTSSSSGSTSSTGSTGSSGSSGTTGYVDAGPACGGDCATPGDYCDTSVDGGVCTAAYAVTLVSPVASSFVDGGGANAVVTVTVAANSGYAQPSTVVLSEGSCGPSGTQLMGAGPFTGTWVPSSPVDGPVQLCATAYWPDAGEVGRSGLETVQVDVTPPTLNLSLLRAPGPTSDPTSGYGTAYIRDEPALPFDPGADDDGGSGVASVSVTIDGVAATSPINLQALPMNAAQKTFTLSAVATDGVGNVSAAHMAQIPVTRWKWVAVLPTPANVLMPAVAADGTAFAAIANGGTPNVAAILPDGGQLWAAQFSGTPRLPPAIAPTNGDRMVVVEANGPTHLLKTADGSDAGFDSINNNTVQSMAIASGGGNPDTADIVAYDGNLYGFRADGTPYLAADNFGLNLSGILAHSQFGVFGTSTPALISVTRSTSDIFGNPTTIAPLAEDPTDSNATASFGPVSDDGGYFFFSDTNRTIGHVSTSSGTETPASVVVSRSIVSEMNVPVAGTVLAALNNGTVARVWVEGGALQTAKTTLSASHGFLAGSDNLYVVGSGTSGGTLVSTFDLTSGLPADGGLGTVAWQSTITDVASDSPAIGCARPGSHESVLLIPTTTGRVIALVIDDSGLRNSPWPKARHDQLNSANSTTPLLMNCP